MEQLRRRLRGSLLLAPEELQAYETDYGARTRVTPKAVAVVASVEDVAATVDFARSRGMRVRPRGHGCSNAGVCLGDDIVVDTRGLGGLHMTAEDRVTAGAGWRFAMLQRELETRGATSLVTPDSLGATFGGLLSVAGYGRASIRAGALVDQIDALDVVNGRGEIVAASRRSNRDLFEFALAGLGRCGIVVGATMRVGAFKRFTVLKGFRRDADADLPTLSEELVGQDIDSAAAIFDVGEQRWLVLTGKDHAEAPTRGAQTLSARVVRHIYRLLPSTPPARSKQSRLRARLSKASGAFYGFRLRLMNDLLASPDGIVISHYHRLQQYLGNMYTPNLVARQRAAGIVIDDDDVCAVWADFMVRMDRANELFSALRQRFRDPNEVYGFFCTSIIPSALPLVPVAPGAERTWGIGVYAVVPRAKLDETLRNFDGAREDCLALGGRQYLYGYHPQSESFYARQFGATTFEAWRAAMRAHDPDRLFQ